jgi:hypothetical protein
LRATRRNPLAWPALIALVVGLGLGSRRFARRLPGPVAAYAGDTLWALAAFLGFGLLLPRASTARVALLALAFSFLIEASQLYHAPWIDSIRGTTLGGLVLGFQFVPSDLACYTLGVALGVVIETIARSRSHPDGAVPRP